MSDVFQVHLSGKKCSGLGVRFRNLSPAEKERVDTDSAKAVGGDASMVEWVSAKGKLGAKRMIVAVTNSSVLEKDIPTAKWRDVNEQILDTEWETLFRAKDQGILVALYREYHEVSESEVEDIAKKVCSVAI